MLKIYEFECRKCGKITEKVVEMEKRPSRVRCECGGWAKRIISAAAVKGDDMPPWQRHLIGNPNDPGVIVDNRMAAHKMIPVPETRSQFDKHCKERNIRVVDTV